MKKFMRIALVFALAGATLVGCTKDYSGDISDLNKKVSEQSAALSALQSQVANAQTAADAAAQKAAEALAEAQKKATPADVQAAEERVNAKINDLVNGDVKALKDAVAALEGIKADERLTDLETAIKDFVTKAELAQELAALKGELEEAIAAGDKVNADAIEALTEKVNKLLADAITIAAPAASVIVNYEYATFNLGNVNDEPYKSLVAAFPEVKAFKGNQITQGGHVPFTVNPESTEFDDTFTYEFVGLDGKTFGTLSEPVEGFVGIDTEATTQSSIVTKAANGFWTLSFAPTIVNSESWNPKSPLIVKDDDVENLSLVITKGENRAATVFAYEALGTNNTAVNPDVNYPLGQTVIYAETIDLLNAKYFDVTAGKEKTGKIVNFTNILDGKFIFSAAAGADNALAIEKYGVKFGEPGESTIKVTKYPENVHAISFKINVKYLGLNGTASEEDFTLTVTKAYATDGVLAAQEITLDDKKASYPVRWNLADYGFTKAQTKEFVEAPSHKLSFTYVDPIDGQTKSATTQDINFYKEDGNTATTAWEEAVSFGFNLDPIVYWPDTYAVTFRVYNSDATIYAAKSTITVKNAEDYKVYLLKELCDENGVLQAVGTPAAGYIEYNIENAFVNEYTNVAYYGFEDAEFNPYAEGKKVANYNWAFDNKPDGDEEYWILRIPINGTLEDTSKPTTSPKFDYVNKTVRNVVAYFEYFGNEANVVEYPFQVKVVSPITGGIVPQDQEIFFNDEPNSFYVRAAVDSAEYVAGWKSGIEYDVIEYTESGYIWNRSYNYDLNENIESVAIAFNKPAEAAKFIEPNVAVESTATLEKQYTWTIEQKASGHDADATKFEIKAKQNYSEQTDLPAGYVVLPATVTVTDKWGIVEKLPFNVKVSIKK